MIQVLDHGYVDLVTTWGSDEDIIRAARMSTNKGFQGWGPVHDVDSGEIKAGDEKLLRYLWEHKHTSVFEQAGATFEIQAPIFIAREIFRHRTFSYNELSARYTELPELCYIPSIERLMNGKQSSVNKQASEAGFTKEQAEDMQTLFECAYQDSRHHYEEFLKMGLSRELSRLVVPVNQYTRWRMSGNLRNWLQMLSLRLGEGVQPETKAYADAIKDILSPIFPRTMELFNEERKD
jgi:thymidylate synthase (FAD)